MGGGCVLLCAAFLRLCDLPFHLFIWFGSLRTYNPPDPCGYFDGHVWPMYLKNRNEMEDTVSDLGVLKISQAFFGL